MIFDSQKKIIEFEKISQRKSLAEGGCDVNEQRFMQP